MPQRLFLVVGLWYLLFVVYGSLVPLDFQPRPLDEAWQRFLNIPWYHLGPQSRADWVANGVLYLPLGFCFTAVLGESGARSGGANLRAGVLVFVMAAVVALCVEFTQQFFPPRTVSLNDIVAELIGAAAGCVVWLLAGVSLTEMVREVTRGGPLAIRAATAGYVLVYLAMSFFPYDFVLTSAELRENLLSGRHDAFIARSACGGFLFCGSKLAAEVAAAVPLGLLLGMMLARRASGLYLKALLAGLALGALIEAGQLIMLSGVSQGFSVLTRGLGLVLGISIQRNLQPAHLESLRPWFRPAVMLAAVPYAAGLLALNGWFSAPWTGLDPALAKLAETNFLPFFYHYYSTEAGAVRSLVLNVGSYLPVGIGYWMWCAGARHVRQGEPRVAAALAAALAFVAETGKLFVPGRKPDPTDVLIAACTAYVAYVVAAAVWRWLTQKSRPPARTAATHSTAPPPTAAHSTAAHSTATHSTAAGAPRPRMEHVPAAPVSDAFRFALRAISLPLLMVAAAFLLRYPYGGTLAGLLALYGALIWFWPKAALPAVLALLPILDVAPWTGWFFFDELDALLLVTVAVLLWRIPAGNWSLRAAGVPGWLAWMLAASYAVSALIGLFPLQPLDANAFSNYLSHYGSLRTLKGFVWAFVLAAPVIHQLREGVSGERAIVTGVLLGLAGVGLVALWERQLFTGIFNFSSDYRIAATFSSLHTGGAQVEAYLVMAIPFLAAWLYLRSGVLARVAAAGLFVLASYALIVTFSRAGFAAYGVGLAIVTIGALLHATLNRKLPPRLLTAALLIAVCAAIAAPLFGGRFMQGRWAQTGLDMNTRSAHWADALSMMDGALATQVFGMGLGRFPETYYLHHSTRTASYRYAQEGDNAYLVLGAGQSLWFEQRLPVTAGGAYTLALDVRSTAPNPDLGIVLCEKSILYSRNCESVDVRPGATDGKWRSQLLTIKSFDSGRRAWYDRRPIHLGLTNRAAGTLVEVDNVRLTDSAGRDLVRNGDFSRGHDHWFFSSDFRQPWHIHSVPLQALFEQGGYGVLALFVALGYAFVRLARGIAGGNPLAPVLMAGLAGFLIVGLFDSLLDTPRLALLFFLLLFAAAAVPIREIRTQRAVNVESLSNPV